MVLRDLGWRIVDVLDDERVARWIGRACWGLFLGAVLLESLAVIDGDARFVLGMVALCTWGIVALVRDLPPRQQPPRADGPLWGRPDDPTA